MLTYCLLLLVPMTFNPQLQVYPFYFRKLILIQETFKAFEAVFSNSLRNTYNSEFECQQLCCLLSPCLKIVITYYNLYNRAEPARFSFGQSVGFEVSSETIYKKNLPCPVCIRVLKEISS